MTAIWLFPRTWPTADPRVPNLTVTRHTTIPSAMMQNKQQDGNIISSRSVLAFEIDEQHLAAHREIADGAETAAQTHDTDRSLQRPTILDISWTVGIAVILHGRCVGTRAAVGPAAVACWPCSSVTLAGDLAHLVCAGTVNRQPSNRHRATAVTPLSPIIPWIPLSHAAAAARHGRPRVPIIHTLVRIPVARRAFNVEILRNLFLTDPVASGSLDDRGYEEELWGGHFDRFKAATPVPRAEGTLEIPEMVARPSTSGGPGERAIQFHKKTLPAPSIYSEDRFLAFSSPTNSSAVLHAVESPADVIGIALGSPTVGSHWTSTPQATTENLIADAHMSLQSHANASTTTITGPEAPPKPKVSRWKSLFRKTAPPPREKQAFYQLAQQVAPARADSHHDTSPKSKSRPKLKTEGGVTVPVSVYNPDAKALSNKSHENVSTTEIQHGRKRSATLDAGRSAPRFRFQRSATTPNPPQAVADFSFLQGPPIDSAQKTAGSALLDVDIPDTKLDRYSVMFSGVLESTPNRSSLYQRRQEKADHEKLKSLDRISVKVYYASNTTQVDKVDADQDNKETLPEPTPPQRAPSPTISNPPSARLSLFPATGRATPTLRAGTPVLRAPSPLVSKSPRARSKTAPARSPTQQTFKAENSKSKPPSTSITRQYSESPNLNPQQPALTPTSIRSFDSSDNDSVTIAVARTTPAEAKAWKAHVESQEPEWEILPKPRSSSVSASVSTDRSASIHRTLSRKQPRVTAASALSSHPSNTPLEVSSPLQNLQMLLSPPLSAEPFKQTAVEQPVIRRTASQRKAKVVGGNAQTATVGIARSVSVSKATRPRTLIRTQPDVVRGIQEPEKSFGEGMALTPMLVEIGHRKSQRVQLVDA
ncbi:hypothetical protein OPT61_g6604 [Boeremia exigua]|uniref:Uncharacterized protein n=1 Tax=Boeremia exigua TaxID=749465 RepID=A0ACC2I664_9PLEO|nr:hypothetical protein OPT61_g6604 [Boeremia exigua]